MMPKRSAHLSNNMVRVQPESPIPGHRRQEAGSGYPLGTLCLPASNKAHLPHLSTGQGSLDPSSTTSPMLEPWG